LWKKVCEFDYTPLIVRSTGVLVEKVCEFECTPLIISGTVIWATMTNMLVNPRQEKNVTCTARDVCMNLAVYLYETSFWVQKDMKVGNHVIGKGEESVKFEIQQQK